MRFRLVACEVLFREISMCAAQSPHIIDVVYLPKGLHDNPAEMTRALQSQIDATDPALDEALVLGYGLCSRGTAGLIARQVPLIIPRCHDCITLLLGSREAYQRHFTEKPGSYYFTAGWIERGGAQTMRLPEQGEGMGKSLQEYIEKYGEDNGRFLYDFENQWQKNYTTAAYLRMPLFDCPAVREQAEAVAAEYGWEVEELPGSDRLFVAMCNGDWTDEDFLRVEPGCAVAQATDETILKAVCPR